MTDINNMLGMLVRMNTDKTTPGGQVIVPALTHGLVIEVCPTINTIRVDFENGVRRFLYAHEVTVVEVDDRPSASVFA